MASQKDRARDQKDDAQKNKRGNQKSENKSKSSGKLEAGKSARTTDHDKIREWVEERGGKPSTVRRTGDKEDPGVLRIDYPGRSNRNRSGDEDRTLEEISWDEFFEKFEEKDLAFLYQDETRTGRVSRFSKFVTRDKKDR